MNIYPINRKAGEKIFTITFAALLGTDFRAPSCDYETYFKLARALTKDTAFDKEQLYRIMCFNVATHNRDDHTKNFSFIHTDLHSWKLVPAYDLTYSDTYWGEHTTSVNGKGREIAKSDIVKVGSDAGLPKKFCTDCYDEINSKVKVLDKYLAQSQNNKEHIHS